MILNIVLIIARIVCGLIAAVFFIGMCLCKVCPTKYQRFENIFGCTGFFVLMYGFASLIKFAIVG